MYTTKENTLDVQLYNAIRVGYPNPVRAILEESDEWQGDAKDDQKNKVGPFTFFRFAETNATAIGLAANCNSTSCVRILLERVQLFLSSEKEKLQGMMFTFPSPIDFKKGYKTKSDLAKEKQIEQNCCSSYKFDEENNLIHFWSSPVHACASCDGRVSTMQLFAEKGLDLNRKDPFTNKTPIMIAFEEKQEKMLKFLVQWCKSREIEIPEQIAEFYFNNNKNEKKREKKTTTLAEKKKKEKKKVAKKQVKNTKRNVSKK
jgi:hypothetical protein